MKLFNILLIGILNIYLVLSEETAAVVEDDDDKINQYEIDHLNILDEHLSECTVLLRRNGDFPLSSKERKIYLYGNGVRKTIKGGVGSGDIKTRSFDNIETAFKKEGFEILSNDYLDAYDDCYQKAYDAYIQKLKSEFDYNDPINYAIAHFTIILNEPECNDLPVHDEGDVAIFVLSRISGESWDRVNDKGDVLFTDSELKTIKTLAKGFKKFMLVLNTGGPVDLSGLDEVKNVLVLSQLGVNTSKTLVDIVIGEKYPSGKLTTTWTRKEDYIVKMGNITDTDYTEGIYVGYRYFDTADIDVMFPFGYGLGYTDFKIKSKNVKLVGDKVTVEASVKNTGKFKGKEVLELYLSKPNSKLDEPYQILVGFTKSKELAPKKKQTLKLEFNLSDFASYDSKRQSYVLNAGSYIVRIGNSSRNTTPCAVIEVPSTVTVKKVKNQIGSPKFQDMKFHSKKKDNLKGVKKFTLSTKSIKTKTIKYTKKLEINKDVKALTTEEKVSFVVGAHSPVPYGTYITSVAGVAGEFYKFNDLKPVVLSDGPAGINIAKDYYIDDSGAHSTKGAISDSALDIIPEDMRDVLSFFISNVPEGAKIYHQHTTAIPIGTALAQTWNIEFAEQCGDIVGTEMNLFKINLWLAPALNIHRSILNGRNFEYYSEDPFISGMMAASVTNGVQKHKNAFVTLKHYAVNNKETNRYGNSSNLSERAFREIYLRGFEIAITKSNPKAIMSSYNLINGVHTNQHVGLIKNILRIENNYNNIIMTDWIYNGLSLTDTYPDYSPYEIIKSTHDVVMPGSIDYYNFILDAIKENKLTMEELESSATRIYELTKEVQE